MKKNYLTLLLLAFATIASAQSYSIHHTQSTYTPLENYNSATLELVMAGEDPFWWEKEFDFGFNFPFYGENYSSVIMDSDGVGYFPQSQEYNLFLFGGDYTIAEPTDPAILTSEIRYAQQNENGIKVLVIEYYNVYVSDEYDENGTNHVINFQTWFYENGKIEVRFGPIDLDNCSYYFPGQGFSFDNQDPTGEIYGPWVSINNNDISEGACFFGDHTNPTILYDDDENCGVLTSIPPVGFSVQFLPAGVSSLEQFASTSDCNFNVAQANGNIQITGDSDSFQSCTIYDLMGKKIGFTRELEFYPGDVTPQILLVQIESNCGYEVHKLMVH